MNHECTEERFLSDIARHEMIVIRNDGIDRHLRFKRPDSTNYYFDLVTWNGNLVITGDMGTYVLSRIADMFEFFRMDRAPHEGTLYINPGYWSEKVQAESRFGNGIREYSEEALRERVKSHFDDHFREEIESEAELRADSSDDNPLSQSDLDEFETAAARRAEIWSAIEDQVLYCANEEHRACQAVYDFQHEDFQFQDFFDGGGLHRFTFHFIWCMYAIVWGVKQFDEATVLTTEVAA